MHHAEPLAYMLRIGSLSISPKEQVTVNISKHTLQRGSDITIKFPMGT
jgi:hypothetical protein